jgi:dTDP-6-deoxy-L-talose 4-dehydrogenase (NAD+)
MKRILVTGATGFIGNYVVRELLKKNFHVIATSANEEKAKKEQWITQVDYIPFSLQDFDQLTNYVTFFNNPDAVIHLAWEGLPNYKSLFHFEENLPRHYALIKNLVRNGVKDVTVAGTCFEYGMQEGCLNEELPAMPANPYALSKDTLRKFLQEIQKFQQFKLKWVRLFYMYGKGQNANSLLSQLEKALANGETTFNMSGGEQVRDYLPVEKVAEYIVAIATQNEIMGIINCCSGKPVTVRELVENYLAEEQKNIHLNLGYYPYPDFEPMHFWGNNKKIKSIING